VDKSVPERLELGDPDRAVWCAFWLVLSLTLRGELAQASGWLARAERLVEHAGRDGPGRGYLLVPTARAAAPRSTPSARCSAASATSTP
jgi:hypothetical protein